MGGSESAGHCLKSYPRLRYHSRSTQIGGCKRKDGMAGELIRRNDLIQWLPFFFSSQVSLDAVL